MTDYYHSLGITAEELDTLQEAFNLYDTMNNGYISIERFSQILSSLGIDCDPKQVAKMADMNNDNQIDFNEFVLTMFRYLSPHEPTPISYKDNHIYNDKDAVTDEEIMQCFQFFDKDHDGRISQNELEQVMRMFNTHLSQKEIKEMMFTADINRDGFIDYDEFKQLLPQL
jgi:Ca2+-binding EF-hand superfamily protein